VRSTVGLFQPINNFVSIWRGQHVIQENSVHDDATDDRKGVAQRARRDNGISRSFKLQF
jgi:hypothetical protein